MHIKYDRVDRDETKAFEEAVALLLALRRIPANLAIYRYRVPVYRLQLGDVMKNKLQLPVQPEGWRYFAGGKSMERTVSGDVNLDAKHPVSNLTYGLAAFRTFTTLTELASLDMSDTGTYSPQYLQIPGLLVEAFRLEPAQQAPGVRRHAVIVPYHTLNKSFERRKLYTDDELFGEIKDTLQALGDDRVVRDLKATDANSRW